MPQRAAAAERILASAALVAALCGCGDRQGANSSAATGGTIVVATTSDPDFLFPPLASNLSARQADELIYDYLAEIGVQLNIIGDYGFKHALADSWSWAPDSASIEFHINPGARWHDGAPVRASDVRFTYALNTSPALGNPMGDDLRNIDSVTVKDSLTSVFWFHTRAPDQFYTAASLMLILPEHVYGKIPTDSLKEAAATARPVGSGRFRFVRWTQGAALEIAADTSNYRGRPSIDRVIFSVSPDYLGALTRLKGGEADVFDALHAENVTEVAANPKLRVIALPGMDYAFLQFNLKDSENRKRPNALFAGRELRRALTMAVDRAALVRSVFDSLATVSIGPTIRSLPTAAATLKQIPYDTVTASAILDSLGWKRQGAGGVRTKNGRELAFTMIVPSSSSARSRMAVLIQSQLSRIGVKADIEKMEYQAFEARLSGRKFDAALDAWHVSANPSAIREVWTTAASRKADGRNFGSYESAVFDAVLDSAARARNRREGLRLYSNAYQTIIDDAPAIWLYEPKTVMGVHRRIQTREMVPGAWWAGLASWSISPKERIRRDALGVQE